MHILRGRGLKNNSVPGKDLYNYIIIACTIEKDKRENSVLGAWGENKNFSGLINYILGIDKHCPLVYDGTNTGKWTSRQP